MAGPWERFANETTAPAAGPWSKFSAETGDAAPQPEAPAAAGQTLMPEPILSGFLGTPDYAKTAHGDQVMGRAVLKGASTGFLGLPALASDAAMNVAYGAKKLASKTGLVEAPDPKNYYGTSESYLPATTALGSATDAGLDKLGLARPETAGERGVSAAFEGAASGVGGFLAGRVAQAGGGMAGGLASQPVQVAAGSGAAAGLAGQGAAEGMNSEIGRQLPDWTPAAVGMATGALTGGALARAAGSAANARAGAAPSTGELRDASNAAYERARSSGVEVTSPAFAGLHDAIRRDLDSAGIFTDLGPGPAVSRVLEPLEASRNSGAPVPMNRMEGIRQNVNTLARSTDPQEARAAQVVKQRFDRFLNEDAVPADFVGGSTPNAPARAVADLREGRALWSRQKKATALEEAMTRTEDRAQSTGSGANAGNVERQEIRKLITPGSAAARRTGLNAEETAQARRIVRGGALDNGLRMVGKLAPTGAVSAIPSALAIGVSGAAGLALPAAGYLAKAGSEAIQRGRVNRLSDTIRRGYALPEVSGAPGAQQGAMAGYLANDDRKPRRYRYR